MHRGVWQPTVHGVAKSWTRLSNFKDVPFKWVTARALIYVSITSQLDNCSVQFSSIQSLSCIRLFATLWTAAHQASLSITSSQSLLKLMSSESVMPSNHLLLCCPLLLLPSVFPSIKIFSNESIVMDNCNTYKLISPPIASLASLTQWTWVWQWWRIGKPGVLQSMGSQRIWHNWATEQQASLHCFRGQLCFIIISPL